MDLEALIRAQHGVCSLSQAVGSGLTEDAVRWRVTSGRWTRLGRGIYRAQTGELDWAGRAHAAALRGGDGCALSLRAAEYLHLVASTPPAVITLAVRGTGLRTGVRGPTGGRCRTAPRQTREKPAP